MGIFSSPTELQELIEVARRIADALERRYPPPLARVAYEKGKEVPVAGITVCDNEETVMREMKEDARIKSNAEKILKEFREFQEWKSHQSK